MANPITPLQFRTGDIQAGSSTALQNLNTFMRQVQTAAEAPVATPSWVQVTNYANGWMTDMGNKTQYAQLPNGQVVFSGVIASGTIGQPAFSLPKTLWPAQDKNFAVVCSGGFGRLIVRAVDGAVTPETGSNTFFCLDGVGYWPRT